MVIAYVGSGGKTTLIHRRAHSLRAQGMKVFVTTTTHMFIESDTILGDDAGAIIHALEANGYAMAGVPFGEKIGPLSEGTYLAACGHADVVLVEADGSKHMPLKFPAAHEPVIPANAGEIIVVCGLQALGKPAREVCHRLELVKACLGICDDTLMTADHIIRLLQEGYFKPLKRKYPGVRIHVHPVHDGTPEMTAAAGKIKEIFG